MSLIATALFGISCMSMVVLALSSDADFTLR